MDIESLNQLIEEKREHDYPDPRQKKHDGSLPSFPSPDPPVYGDDQPDCSQDPREHDCDSKDDLKHKDHTPVIAIVGWSRRTTFRFNIPPNPVGSRPSVANLGAPIALSASGNWHGGPAVQRLSIRRSEGFPLFVWYIPQ